MMGRKRLQGCPGGFHTITKSEKQGRLYQEKEEKQSSRGEREQQIGSHVAKGFKKSGRR